MQVLALREPWDWLLPALCAAGQPVLDPRFNFLIDPAASGSAGPAEPAAAAALQAALGEEPAVGPAVGLAPVPALPVHMVVGLQPLVGRPPFLGPLVQKLAATQHVLGGLDFSCSICRPVQQLSTGLPVLTGSWNEQMWSQLFALLADHPPRDVQPDGVQFLRSLPMYRLVSPAPQQQQQEQGHGQPVVGSAADPGAGSGGSRDGEQDVSTQLVALGSGTDWVLAPSAVLQACAGGLQACVFWLIGSGRDMTLWACALVWADTGLRLLVLWDSTTLTKREVVPAQLVTNTHSRWSHTNILCAATACNGLTHTRALLCAVAVVTCRCPHRLEGTGFPASSLNRPHSGAPARVG